MKRTSTLVALVMALSLLASCGYTQGDRALSGAGIGAATGAVGSALVGGSALGGAVLGGAVGAAAGALSSPNDVYLGKPIWRH